jgi:hypothetical protein
MSSRMTCNSKAIRAIKLSTHGHRHEAAAHSMEVNVPSYPHLEGHIRQARDCPHGALGPPAQRNTLRWWCPQQQLRQVHLVPLPIPQRLGHFVGFAVTSLSPHGSKPVPESVWAGPGPAAGCPVLGSSSTLGEPRKAPPRQRAPQEVPLGGELGWWPPSRSCAEGVPALRPADHN